SAGALLEELNGAFYQLGTGLPYNPASGHFTGFDYTLTAPDGTQYHYATAGGLREMTGPGGQRLVWSSSGVLAMNGDQLAFQRDDAGRITRITSTDGRQIAYSYDSAGNLVEVTDLQTLAHSRFAYAVPPSHLV